MKRLKLFILGLLFTGFSSFSWGQVDTEFWFVVPELSHRGNTGGTPGTLRMATLELDATVTIEMPANPAFTPIVLDIAANSEAAVDLSYLIDYLPGNPGVSGLENKALTPNGINSFGLHITASNMISAYWEVNYIYGSDVWPLKGSNGLGTLFYTPFQTDYPNHFTFMPSHSAIDVVASQDNTNITFTLPDGVGASYGEPMNVIPASTPGNTYTVRLNQGETFSLFPLLKSTDTYDRLAGARISSDNPIAVVLKDDNLNTASQGRSSIGDQMVPVDVAGDTYVVPAMGNPNLSYIVATEDNTNIYVNDPGSAPTLLANLDAGEQLRYQSPNNTVMVISSRNGMSGPPGPTIYVWHMALNNMTRAAALLPPIGCTGNTQLAFTRAREAVRENFYFFVLTEDENVDNFWIDGVPADPTIISNDIAQWEQLGNGWSAFFSRNIPASKLPIGQHLVENTGGIFHLGIINGYTSANMGDLLYGYVSDYGGLNVGAVVAGTNSSVVRSCLGDPVQLHAFGGTTYEWTPHDYLDDPYSNQPTAINLPPGPHEYIAHVSGACGSGDVPITVLVSPPVIADFMTDLESGCSPLEVTFHDLSVGAYSWQYDLGDGTPLILYDSLEHTPNIGPPPDPFIFTHTYTNTTDTIQDYEIRLLVRNSSGCVDTISRIVRVFPEIGASYAVDRNQGCSPLEVEFTDNSWGSISNYFWHFGDGTTSTSTSPVFNHTYVNYSAFPETYQVTFSVENEQGCVQEMQEEITVYPETSASFMANQTEACSPAEILFDNTSIGASHYHWDFGDGGSSDQPYPTHYYQPNFLRYDTVYTVMLVATSSESCTDTTWMDITIHPYIEAAFSVADTMGGTPFNLEISNESMGADDYFWDFGDGSPVSNESSILLNHVYQNSGNAMHVYPLQLVVSNEEGCSDTLTRNISVLPEITASFSADVQVGCHPLTVEFTDRSQNALNYHWDFGDGVTSVENSPIHTFTNTGTTDSVYLVILTVETADGGYMDTATVQITVHPQVIADFSMPHAEGCSPYEVTFTNTSRAGSNFTWRFGDGSTLATSHPDPQTHMFVNNGVSNPRVCEVSLEVVNDFGCMHTASKTVAIYLPPEGGTIVGGDSPIVFGNSTGMMTVQGHYGDIVMWQKRLNGSPWSDTDQTETSFSDVPGSAGSWVYRVQVGNEICPAAYSDSLSILVQAKTVYITPAEGQQKKEGDPDPVFEYTNSEWSDNSSFTGQLEREAGEEPGEYAYMPGDLSAGDNYALVMSNELVTFTILSTVGIDEYQVSDGLALSNYSNPFRESTTFRYSLPFDGRVSLTIYNMAGQEVRTLISNRLETTGEYRIAFHDNDMEAGIYFAILRLDSDRECISKTIKLIRSR